MSATRIVSGIQYDGRLPHGRRFDHNGGLIGYNTGTVKHVEAEGDAVKYTSMEDMPSGSLFRYQVTAASGSYVGGIIGMTRQLKTQRS